MNNIEICSEWPHTSAYVGVVVFQGEGLVLVQVDGRGMEFPIDRRQPSETYEESAHRIMMEQLGSTPLIMGKLGVETLEDESQIVYLWAVVDALNPSHSMNIGYAKTFDLRNVAQHPMAYQRKVLYDEAARYAALVAEQLNKIEN